MVFHLRGALSSPSRTACSNTVDMNTLHSLMDLGDSGPPVRELAPGWFKEA